MLSTIFDEDLALMLTIFFVRGEVLLNANGRRVFENMLIICPDEDGEDMASSVG